MNELEYIKSLSHNMNLFNLLRNELKSMNWFISDPDFIKVWNSGFSKLVDNINHQERYQNAINKFNSLVGPTCQFNE